MNTGKGRQVYKVVAEYQPEGHANHRKEFVVALLVLLVVRNMTKQMAAGMPGSAQQAA